MSRTHNSFLSIVEGIRTAPYSHTHLVHTHQPWIVLIPKDPLALIFLSCCRYLLLLKSDRLVSILRWTRILSQAPAIPALVLYYGIIAKICIICQWMLKNCHIKLIFRFPGSPVADNLLIGAAHRRIIRITKADGCVLSQSVVKCSAKHPGLAIIFFGSFCLLLFPGLYIYDDGVSFHGNPVYSNSKR